MTTTIPTILRKVSYNSICRTCLGAFAEDTLNLFEAEYEGIGLREIIKNYIGTQVEINDGLPKSICKTCIGSLVSVYAFVKQCEKSDTSLRTVINNNKKPVRTVRAKVGAEEHSLCSPVAKIKEEYPDNDVIVIPDEVDSPSDAQQAGKSIQNNENLKCIEELRNIETQTTHLETAETENEKDPNTILFYCLTCRDAFDSLVVLRQHRKIHHPRPQNLKCLQSARMPNFDSSMKHHLEFTLTCNTNNEGTLNIMQDENLYATSENTEVKNESVIGNTPEEIGNIGLKDNTREEVVQKQICCVLCNFPCDSFSILRHHMTEMHRPKSNKALRELKSNTIKCTICGKCFAYRLKYLKHVGMHKRQLRKYTERLSGKKFGKKWSFDCSDLREYLLKLNTCRANIYPCAHCDKYFITRLHFQDHKENVKLSEKIKVLNESTLLTGEKPNEILVKEVEETPETIGPVIEKSLPVNSDSDEEDDNFFKYLKRLKEANLFRFTLYWCKACIKFFDGREQYLSHKKEVKHLVPLRHACPICKKAFKHRERVKLHMRCHTKEKPFMCKVCGVAFSFGTSLKRHVMIHTGEKPYVCELCGKGFIQLVCLQQHQKMHTNEYSYLCSYCGINCKSYQNYMLHLATHIPPDENGEQIKKYQCNICLKMFSRVGSLYNHNRIHMEQKLLCNYCGKGFVHLSTLSSHIRTHTGDRPFKCIVCKARFAQKISLKGHMRSHTGEKPYQCEICGKAFRQSVHVKYHMICVHTKVRDFKCSYCGKCFALKGNLTLHTRIHTGETPFICNVCGRGFYHSNNMKKHRRTHGPLNPECIKNNLEEKETAFAKNELEEKETDGVTNDLEEKENLKL